MKPLPIFCFLLLFLHNNSTAQDISFSSCGPIPPLCTPGRINSQLTGIGMYYIHFAEIDRAFPNSTAYFDYSCSDSTNLIQGNTYEFIAHTGQTYEECIRMWLDFNNDGAYDTTEIIFADSAMVFTHSGYVTIQQAGLLNTPLRLRVASDYSIYPPVNACLDVQWGNYRDFTVYLEGPDAISETVARNSLSVFPNPFTDQAQIKFENDLKDIGNCTLKIYDVIGSFVKEETFINSGSMIINRDQLSAGLFYFCLYNEEKILGTGKFIIE
jgi:hypothetical protein